MIFSLGGLNLEPEQNLILAIVRQGLHDRDTQYFKSESFDFHCELLGLDSDKLRTTFLRKINEQKPK